MSATDIRERADERRRDRELTISWLRVKLFDHSAGLDPFDASVLIVEVASPDRAWRLDHVGQILESHPHVRPDRSTCIRVRALIEADVRQELGLDDLNPPVLDTPLASRALRAVPEAAADILEFDRSRRAGRGWQR